MGSLGPAIPATAVCCMTLVVTTSLSSIQQLLSETEMSGDGEFDKLELRNRTVTETLSPVEDLGQDKKEKASDEDQGPETKNGDHSANGNGDEKYDKLELRNRTVTETLSLVKDLGQDNKEEEKAEEEGGEKFELRNRTVTETMSLVSDFGKNEKEEDDEEPVTKKQKFDTLSLRNRDVTETLSPLEN